jgi:hypothetical protein
MTGVLCLMVSLALNLTVEATYALPAVMTGSTATQDPAQTATGNSLFTATGNPAQTGTSNPIRTATPSNTPGSGLTSTVTNTPRSNAGSTNTPRPANTVTRTLGPANTVTRTLRPANTAQIQPTVQASGTPGSALLAPSIISLTPTIDDPSAVQLSQQQEWMLTATASDPSAVGQSPAALIPVTGMDLSTEQNKRQLMVSRIHQMQTGLNFLGLGLILMGITLMSSSKTNGRKKVF